MEVPVGPFTVLTWPSPKSSCQRVTDQSSIAILRYRLRSRVSLLLRTPDTTVGDPTRAVGGEAKTRRSRSRRAAASAMAGWSTGLLLGLAHIVVAVPKFGSGVLGEGGLIWTPVVRSKT